ncbi:hypothetical protein ACEZDB_16680 [Streptacidiphilus sp. N1-3]|uniref:MFS transporter n=1 Tax=Streptacidiphilus alkalitolerans TaxID=3342712 RepID=A0ABV6X345_9ACTN
MVAFGFINAALAGCASVLGPAVADATFGRSWWGGVLAAETAGAVLGGLVALRWRPQRLLLVGVACVGAGVALPLGLALHIQVYVLAAAGFLCGMCLEQFGVAWETSLQQEVPGDRLARVYSYDMVGSFVAIPVAQVAIGPLASAFGVRDTLLGAAAVILLGTLAMLAVRDVRTLRVRRADGAPNGAPDRAPDGAPGAPLPDTAAGGELPDPVTG